MPFKKLTPAEVHVDDFTKRLRAIWRKFPNMNLGTLITNCVDFTSFRYLSDSQLIAKIEATYKPLIKDPEPEESEEK